ncbi:hypothetical protein MTR_2g026860 [Medicago truncatula]|uniref:Uncharacterized protein n=1 Tax=Medicago truncatula TaxID=3880 RepID=G7IPC8_MEDTR|nr:hypothetical protein MTR_2g026860 [Medicago truncatula]
MLGYVKQGYNDDGKTVLYLIFEYMDTYLKKFIRSFCQTSENISSTVIKTLFCRGWQSFGVKELDLGNKWAFEGEKIIHGKGGTLLDKTKTMICPLFFLHNCSSRQTGLWFKYG